MEEEQVQPNPNLLESIRTVVRANSSISHLCECISEGVIDRNNRWSTSRLEDVIQSDWIRLYKLNKVYFKKVLNYLRNLHHYTDSDKKQYFNIFNPAYQNIRKDLKSFFMGYNIFKDIKIMGYNFNICDIFSMRDSRENLFTYIYKFLFISEKNYLVGFIDCDCILWLDSLLLDKIRRQNQSEFEDLIKRIFKTYSNANAMFMETNTEYSEKTIFDIVGKKLVSTINDDLNKSRVITESNIDIFADDNMLEAYISRISSTIQSTVRKCLKDNFLGVNDEYSYQKLLTNILRNYNRVNETRLHKAFMQGLSVGNKMECIGWKLQPNARIDEYKTGLVWEKDVCIIPNLMYYKHKEYVIDPSDDNWTNPFKITKLYVTSEGVMYCEGNHPNVSSGKVCMGDISGKISFTDIENLQKNLNRCEALLYVINYDSAYRSDKIEEMLKHSKISEIQKISDGEYVAQGATIQDISWEEDDDSPQSIEMEEVRHDQ